jgi:PAS domain-containing protein
LLLRVCICYGATRGMAERSPATPSHSLANNAGVGHGPHSTSSHDYMLGRELDRRLAKLHVHEVGTNVKCSMERLELSRSESSPARIRNEKKAVGEVAALRTIDFDSLARTTSLPGESTWRRVLVQCDQHLSILSADARWLRLLGFARSEILGRSMRVLCGPKSAFAELRKIMTTATGRASSPTWVRLHHKSGDELCLIVRATLRAGSGERCVVLEMQPFAEGAGDSDDEHEDPEGSPRVVVAAAPPHVVLRTSAGFDALLGFTQSRVRERGVAALLARGASRTRWREVIARARARGAAAARLTARDVHGCEVVLLAEASRYRSHSDGGDGRLEVRLRRVASDDAEDGGSADERRSRCSSRPTREASMESVPDSPSGAVPSPTGAPDECSAEE